MDDNQIGAAILAGAADAVVVVDREGVITHWNPGATRIYGFEAADVVGGTLDVIIPERLREAHWEGFDNFVETGTSKYPEGHLLRVPALTASGSTISIEFTIVALTDEAGAVSHAVAVMRDVTEMFEMAKQLRRELRELKREQR